jgi:transglutaminase-like putative cysteine protease
MSAPPELRWRRLAWALLESPELRITETRLGTVTAAEAFRTRRANCVAFAHLARALAREVGLDARFVLMEEIEGYEGRGDLRIAFGHLAVGFGPPEKRTVLDLSGLTRPPNGGHGD